MRVDKQLDLTPYSVDLFHIYYVQNIKKVSGKKKFYRKAK